MVPTFPLRLACYNKLIDHLLALRGSRQDIELVSMLDTHHGGNGGRHRSEKFNLLMAWASGKYLMFVHDDDWLEDSFLEETIPALEQDPDQVLFWLRVLWGGDVFNTCKIEHGERDRRPGPPGSNYYYCRPQMFNIWRSDLAKRIPFENSPVADCNWCAGVDALCRKTIVIPKELYHYRQGYPKEAHAQ